MPSQIRPNPQKSVTATQNLLADVLEELSVRERYPRMMLEIKLVEQGRISVAWIGRLMGFASAVWRRE